MKIALFDPYRGKFTSDMVKWWEAHGHEVRTDPQGYYNPEMVDWADIVWFDTVSNNLISATNPEQALIDEWRAEQRKGEWDIHLMDMSQKKVIVRAIDIDVWSGHHASVKWDAVNACIFIAPHIRDIMMADSRPQDSNMNIYNVPHAIDLSKWTFKEREPGFNIAVVAEIWESKGIDYVLQIALKLKMLDSRYKITYLGKEQDYHWHRHYRAQFIEENQLPIEFVDWVDDLDGWLEDKNYLLHASTKEAFSAATAEAAAKGIKPVLHAFGGYKPLWGDSGWIWQGIDEAVDMIANNEYDSKAYRQYLIDKGYDLDSMMQKFEQIMID